MQHIGNTKLFNSTTFSAVYDALIKFATHKVFTVSVNSNPKGTARHYLRLQEWQNICDNLVDALLSWQGGDAVQWPRGFI